MARGKFQGMLTIARFNWPFYIAASLVLFASGFGIVLAGGVLAKMGCAAVCGGSAYFVAGSLGVSHLIYDRSDLYRLGWVDRALGGATVRHAVFCHCGFDEA